MTKLNSRANCVACIAVLIVALVGGSATADRERTPIAHSTPSFDGRFVFEMRPNTTGSEKSGDGTLWRILQRGIREPVYTTTGWFSRRVFVGSDGRNIVRLGNWPRTNDAAIGDHLAIAFYHKGKLIKSYTVGDLIFDLGTLPRSVSHYRFYRAVDFIRTKAGERIRLELVDGRILHFNVRTGNIESSN